MRGEVQDLGADMGRLGARMGRAGFAATWRAVQRQLHAPVTPEPPDEAAKGPERQHDGQRHGQSMKSIHAQCIRGSQRMLSNPDRRARIA
jgi:hypothetical protein